VSALPSYCKKNFCELQIAIQSKHIGAMHPHKCKENQQCVDNAVRTARRKRNKGKHKQACAASTVDEEKTPKQLKLSESFACVQRSLTQRVYEEKVSLLFVTFTDLYLT